MQWSTQAGQKEGGPTPNPGVGLEKGTPSPLPCPQYGLGLQLLTLITQPSCIMSWAVGLLASLTAIPLTDSSALHPESGWLSACQLA